MTGKKSLFAVLVALPVAFALCLKFLPVPYVWIGGLSLLWVVHAFRNAESVKARFVLFNLGVLILFLGLSEAYLAASRVLTAPPEERYERGYFTTNEVLGRVPTPGFTTRAIRQLDDDVIYDTVYTID